MLTARRLINLAVIAFAAFTASKSAGGRDAAFEAGRFIGMGLVASMPALAFFGLRRRASRGLRKAAIVSCYLLGDGAVRHAGRYAVPA